MKSQINYRLRGLDQANLAEVELLNLMYYHPVVMAAKGYPSADPLYGQKVDLMEPGADIFEAESVVTREARDLAFAIADEYNHLVGWIWFYQDARHPLPIKVANRYGLTDKNCRFYQLSYEKLMSDGWPIDLVNKVVHVKKEHLTIPRKGVVVKGLRLAINRLIRGYRKLYAKRRTLALYAFVHPSNVASCKVLDTNGFTKIERMYSYDGELHQLWVRIIK